MPALRSTRRSRRLSNRPPTDPEFETLDDDELTLLYPECEPVVQYPRATHTSTCSTPTHSSSELSRLSSPIYDSAEDAAFAPRALHGRRKRLEGHIPRPPNAFMMYRSEYWRIQKRVPDGQRDHREISKSAGLEWKKLNEHERKKYEDLARLKKIEHEKMYPGYRYAPTSKREPGTKKERKSARDSQAEAERCQKAADAVVRRAFLRGSNGASAASHSPVDKRSPTSTPVPVMIATRSTHNPKHRRRPSGPAVVAQRGEIQPETDCSEDSVQHMLPFHSPELSPPSHVSDYIHDCNGFVPTEQIPTLDLSQGAHSPIDMIPFSELRWPGLVSPMGSLFDATDSLSPISQYPPQNNTPYSVDLSSPSSSLMNSPESAELQLMYPDTRSDSTDSPTSGLLSCPKMGSFDLDPNTEWDDSDWFDWTSHSG